MNFSCSICMESFGTNCAIATIPCGHVFHEACIKKWHIDEKNCAMCRKKCKAEEISKLFISESESALKNTDICNEYEEKILNLNKEIHDLKIHKQKVNFSELNEKNLKLKAENVRLELGLKECEKKCFTLNGTLLESQEDNIKLTTKLLDLKSHERNVQKTLRDAIEEEKAKKKEYLGQFIEAKREFIRKKKQNKKSLLKFVDASNKLAEKQIELDTQIAATKKSESEIKALQAKYLNWVPSYQIPRRNKKRKQLQDKSATIKPPTNKKKKQPSDESNTPAPTPDYSPTPIRKSRSRSRSSSPSLRSISSSRSPIRYDQDTLIPNGQQSRSRSSSRSSTNSSNRSTSPDSQYTPTWPRSRLRLRSSSRSSSGSSSRSSSNSSCSSSPSYSRTTTQYSPNSPGYTPTSPQYSPNSPGYSPTNPSYSLTSPEYTPTSQTYSPTSPSYSLTSPQYTPTRPSYSPISPSYSPTSPQYTLTSATYSPTSPSYSPTSPTSPSYSPTSPPELGSTSESELDTYTMELYRDLRNTI